MALVHEYLGYNRFGLRYVTAREVRERKKRVLSHDFSQKADAQNQETKATEWFLAFLALTIASQKAKEPLFKNLNIFKKSIKEKFTNTR